MTNKLFCNCKYEKENKNQIWDNYSDQRLDLGIKDSTSKNIDLERETLFLKVKEIQTFGNLKSANR